MLTLLNLTSELVISVVANVLEIAELLNKDGMD